LTVVTLDAVTARVAVSEFPIQFAAVVDVIELPVILIGQLEPGVAVEPDLLGASSAI